MKCENMKEVSHGFCKKYKILQKLVCVMSASSGPLQQVNLKLYRNMVLQLFRRRFSGLFANEPF